MHVRPPVAVGTVDDEPGLVERARTDPVAFETLYRRYVGAIHAFAYRRTRSQAVAEDVTAATFERAWRALPTFSWRGSGFRAWLFRIAANELADHFRRERAASRLTEHQRHDLEAVSRAARFQNDDEDDVAEVLVVLGSLNPRYQQAISLRFLAGLSHEEAAAAMGCSKPMMAVTLHRALRALQRAMRARRK